MAGGGPIPPVPPAKTNRTHIQTSCSGAEGPRRRCLQTSASPSRSAPARGSSCGANRVQDPLACALSRFAWDVSCAGDRSSAQLACALSPDAPEHVRVLSHHLTPRRQHLFVPATRDCTMAQRVVGQRAARLVRATTEAGTPGPDRNPGASAALPHGRATGCRRAARKGLSLAVAAHWPGHQQAGSAGCSPTRPPDPPAAAPLG
jgi:hypothetical protein